LRCSCELASLVAGLSSPASLPLVGSGLLAIALAGLFGLEGRVDKSSMRVHGSL
jgi:hypothetical protein